MWGAARNLDADSVRNLALYFASLPPRAASDGVPSLVGLGQTTSQQGMPEANIVACVVCHGPNGEGIRDIPRLGGLDSTYLRRRLEQWNQGYHVSAGPPMISIASKLSDDQIEALASYLSFISKRSRKAINCELGQYGHHSSQRTASNPPARPSEQSCACWGIMSIRPEVRPLHSTRQLDNVVNVLDDP
jgi:cytochrome c553